MTRWAAILTAVTIAVATVVSPEVGLLAVVLALVVLSVAFWCSTIVDLLRAGPGREPLWWTASLVVVVVLGPLGALVYRIAEPAFDRETVSLLRRR